MDRYFQMLDKAFNKLEETLKHREHCSKFVGATKYEEALGILTIEKSDLEQQLKQKIEECEEWRNVYHEVIAKLNLVINNISSVLREECVHDEQG